jgi:hypothetical protein
MFVSSGFGLGTGNASPENLLCLKFPVDVSSSFGNPFAGKNTAFDRGAQFQSSHLGARSLSEN